jgi:hypothetical protein
MRTRRRRDAGFVPAAFSGGSAMGCAAWRHGLVSSHRSRCNMASALPVARASKGLWDSLGRPGPKAPAVEGLLLLDPLLASLRF